MESLVKTISEEDKKKYNSSSRLYSVWRHMRTRCTDTKSNYAHLYVGKGIKVCEEWQVYANFREWALNNGYDDSLSINRIDSNGNYEPSNCRWADAITQSNNTSRNVFVDFDGQHLTIAQWERKLGFPRHLLQRRLKAGWSVELAITTPKINSDSRRDSKGRYCAIDINNLSNR